MRSATTAVNDILLRMRSYFQGSTQLPKYTSEEPIRSELFSSDQMEQQGTIVAAAHRINPEKKTRDQLLKRLDDNEKVLLEVRNLLVDAVKTNRRITPAAEWLLDNFYLIEEQIVIGKKHLPKGYSQSLPTLATGASAGLPRVYDIALEIISHSDGRIDLKSLGSFLAAYQSVTTLTIGELWAIPIMLRLALIENLRRVSSRIAIDKIDHNLAHYWTELLIEAAEKNPKNIILIIGDMARSNPPMSSPFVAELTRRLQGKGPTLAMALSWMEQHLSEIGVTSNELVHLENQKQASDQVSMSNSIGSLRFLGATDWREFVESLSSMEQILREDDTYTRMDFFTRDQYRKKVESIAKHSELCEEDVARVAIDLSKKSAAANEQPVRKWHVGYYLVDKGFPETQAAAKMKLSAWLKFRSISKQNIFRMYSGSIAFVSLLVSGFLFWLAWTNESRIWVLVGVALLSLVCSSQMALSLVNWLSTLIVSPKFLPRMDYSRGIPPEKRTLIIIPSMLSDVDAVQKLIEGLEVRYLANSEAHLNFGLLTDFQDAPQEKMPEDEELLKLVQDGIKQLNEKYKREGECIFFLFHRPRKWNPKEGAWMGYERKRGKLSDLNNLLRGGNRDAFSRIVGDYRVLNNVKYVITLDTDTQLPRETAWQLIATMAHPLNHAVYSEKEQRVIDGYGILQPRIAVSLPNANKSRYAQMQGNHPGLDPYTLLVSDVYQDLFGEGSFIGKGIYDLDIFRKTLNGRFPENRILSHDLLEGSYVRSGLLSDVELYEEYPSSYYADVKRRHRWIRGDWQIATWILPFAPDGSGRLKKNTLNAFSKWRIFDNLRRSLVPIAYTLFFLLSWIVLSFPALWTFILLLLMVFPVFLAAAWQLLNKPDDLLLGSHLKEVSNHLLKSLFQSAFSIACMPYEAFYNFDAILLTNWRLLVSRNKLLEWIPYGSQRTENLGQLIQSYYFMWISPTTGVIALTCMLLFSEGAIPASTVIFTSWMLSPLIAWWISLPLERKAPKLSSGQYIFLRKQARKVWAFFEEFVGEEHNWLPPDNYQEQPVNVVAQRTSPTNIGLCLLANLTAYDFGYIDSKELSVRIQNTMETVKRMEKYKGHLYNWYDTQTLQPLPPRYISTVDSGNLAGHLITLRQGILNMQEERLVHPFVFIGIRDTFRILRDQHINKNTPIVQEFRKFIRTLCDKPVDDLRSVKADLEQCHQYSLAIFEHVKEETEAHWWLQKLEKQIKNKLEALSLLAPWLQFSAIDQKYPELALLNKNLKLSEVITFRDELFPLLDDQAAAEDKEWINTLKISITEGARFIRERLVLFQSLAADCDALSDMDYSFLYDRSKHLLRIGYNVDERRNDASYYDMLASEARLCVFIAIAQGKLPQESWFALGRWLTNAGGYPVLLSWSGSMFEYLMPLLVMPTYENTLLDQTNKSTVQRQIEYGRQMNIPWGISESGFNMMDANLNYQYRAFGVPGLGLKRGLSDDIVIAPYASMLALMVNAEEACHNLQVLSKEGLEGKFGFYEAVDYTAARLPRKQTNVLIQSYMVHHQGMSFLSLAYLLLDQPMQKRFEAEPLVQSTLLLLQERIPRASIFYSHTADINETLLEEAGSGEIRAIFTPDTPVPEIQLLSNSRYQVMVSNSGGGYTRWKDMAVTRWREDCTMDNWGIFCYIKDLESGEFWSNTHQPSLKSAKNYEAVFSQDHAEFRRRDPGFETRTEIVVSPEDDIEIRRVRITNHSSGRKTIEITSYAEVVLNSQPADALHPAFSNLFVQTEIIPGHPAIVCTRRPRSGTENPPFMFHLMTVHGGDTKAVSYETDRMRFIGRGNTIANPAAMQKDGTLSGSAGSVLDPIVSIRYKVNLRPNQTITVDMVFGIGETRQLCMSLMEKYQDRYLKNRAFELSWTHSQVLLRQINASEADAQLYARLAGAIIYVNPALRADAGIIKSNYRGQSGLWSYAISGDLPIVLLRIQDAENIELIKQMIQAHAYWRFKGLAVDLVIWNEDFGSYRQLLHDQILGLVTAVSGSYSTEKPGGIFVRSADQISNEDRILIQTVARVVISDTKGTLAEQVNKRAAVRMLPPALIPVPVKESKLISSPKKEKDLVFFNGLGGFSADGKEYVILTGNNKTTPVPWINVIANANFGTIISESGAGYTWDVNAHEYRLSAWHNDPVCDKTGEAYYIRDEESGHFWSPSALPVRGRNSTYRTRHGFGYSIFEHVEDAIRSEMCVYVDLKESIKFVVLKIKNESDRMRKLSATGYVDLVLGDLRSKTVMHIVTEVDKSGAIFSRNKYNSIFAEKITFFDVNDLSRTITTDRAEFVGRNSNLSDPDGMRRVRLSGKTGCSYDACAAMQVTFELQPQQEREIIFKLGTGDNLEQAQQLVEKFKVKTAAAESLKNVRAYWEKTLDTMRVETPETSLNILANGWLIYQSLACRVWAKSGFYQSGGAFGFRDQLQDVLSFISIQPDLTRAQILLCASRQFREGDVQHWWHPPTGRGVRTRCSDDFLWLPFVTARYIEGTGDIGILKEQVNYLDGRPLNFGEDSYYDLPTQLDFSETLYQHCIRAIRHGLRFGEHGLPLIGSGDWNDGMDRIGIEGKGESVWLGFFMYDVLNRFIRIAGMNKDESFAAECKKQADKLRKNLERNGWDGEWYRRAYFDDGTPVGTASAMECKIDSISQSWSVLSGAADPERAKQAMHSVDQYLVRRDVGLIQLLDPPFDKTDQNPGYIKGYVPGVRENGGQYTHAAVWATMAFAKLGNPEKVWELFSLINPVNHGKTEEQMRIYKVESYVVAADVYGEPPHSGRGGWTWYTGSAGWMYQLIVESILGIKVRNGNLEIRPCIPSSWSSFSVRYRFGETDYNIRITQETNGNGQVSEKSNEKARVFPLVNDGGKHDIEIKLQPQPVSTNG